MLTIKTFEGSTNGERRIEFDSPLFERALSSIIELIDCPTPMDESPPEEVIDGDDDWGKPISQFTITNEHSTLIWNHMRCRIEETLKRSNRAIIRFDVSALESSDLLAIEFKPSGEWLGRLVVEGASLGMSPEQVESVLQSQPPTLWHALEQLEADPHLEMNRFRQIKGLKDMAKPKPSPEDDPAVKLASCLITEFLAVFQDVMACRSAKPSGASKTSPAIPYNTWIVQVEEAAAARRASKNLTRNIMRSQAPGVWVDMWKQHLTPDQAWLQVATEWAKNNPGANVGDIS